MAKVSSTAAGIMGGHLTSKREDVTLLCPPDAMRIGSSYLLVLCVSYHSKFEHGVTHRRLILPSTCIRGRHRIGVNNAREAKVTQLNNDNIVTRVHVNED